MSWDNPAREDDESPISSYYKAIYSSLSLSGGKLETVCHLWVLMSHGAVCLNLLELCLNIKYVVCFFSPVFYRSHCSFWVLMFNVILFNSWGKKLMCMTHCFSLTIQVFKYIYIISQASNGIFISYVLTAQWTICKSNMNMRNHGEGRKSIGELKYSG